MEYMNSSTYDEETVWKFNNKIALDLAPTTAILVLYAIIGITGNSISIYIYKYRMKKVKGQRAFILCLSATDMASCIVSTGFTISLDLLPLTFRWDIICKLVWVLNSFLTISSIFLLLLIAIHRYRLICAPFRKPFNLFWRRWAVIVTFVVSMILSIPNLAFYGESKIYYPQYNISGSTCSKSHDQQYAILFFVYSCVLLATFAIGATTLVVLYSLIGKTILARPWNKSRERKQRPACSNDSIETVISENASTCQAVKLKDMSDLTQINHTKTDDVSTDTLSKSDRKDNSKSMSRFHKHRHVLMFMLITLIFLISYAPYITIMIVKSVYPNLSNGLPTGQYRTYLFFLRMYILNNIVNPFLYGAFDIEFRAILCQMLPFKCRKPEP